MKKVTVHQAKTQLSKLLIDAASGEDVIIARGGKPVARLVAYDEREAVRKPGRYRGKIRVSDDFDAALPASLMRPFKK